MTLLAVVFDLPTAMALLLVPSFVTNLWQSIVGGNGRAILLRLWPFLLMATVTVGIGAALLTRIDLSLLSALLVTLFVVPGVIFLQAIGLSRDMLIQARGMLFTLSTVALAAALQTANFLTVEHGVLSLAAVLPAIVGMIVGQRMSFPRNFVFQEVGYKPD